MADALLEPGSFYFNIARRSMFFEKVDVQLRIQIINREVYFMIWKLKAGADFLRPQQPVAPEQSDVDPDMLLDPHAPQRPLSSKLHYDCDKRTINATEQRGAAMFRIRCVGLDERTLRITAATIPMRRTKGGCSTSAKV